ncbi:MAG: Gfo/Idh/MocA family oxidoreductase [Planctomycetes bacterium]|nr:Gfo/Idh/MocA family oxidoreductase [Planctomycetota bacterium]
MRIGIIGLRGHVSDCMKGAAQWKDATIVAVSDADKEEVAKFCKKQKLAEKAEQYEHWQHLLEHTEMDVCVVADENGLRAEQLVKLAQHGVHICSEKPLATTLEDLSRVRKTVDDAGVKLTMLLRMRYEAKYRTMRELIQKGAVGKVGLVTAQKSYRLEERDDWERSRKRLGGTIPYIGVHALDLMRWVPGLDFTHLAAFHANVATPEFGESEDTASVLVRYGNGATGTARLDYLLPEAYETHGDDRLRIAGGDGVIETQQAWNYIALTTAEKKTYQIDPGPSENMFVDFLHSVVDGTPCRFPKEDAYGMTEIVLKARDAADKKELITLLETE